MGKNLSQPITDIKREMEQQQFAGSLKSFFFGSAATENCRKNLKIIRLEETLMVNGNRESIETISQNVVSLASQLNVEVTVNKMSIIHRPS